jgi:acetyltransferase-like isoleucine patch superfamily enzyme
MTPRLPALIDAHAARRLDPYQLIGGPGYLLVGLDAVREYSVQDIKSGAVPGIELTGAADASNVFLVGPRRPNALPLRVGFGHDVRDCLVFIGPDCALNGDIHFFSSASTVLLNGGMVHGGNVRVQCWGTRQTLFVGHRASTNGNIYVLGGAGRVIIVGEDCMFATNVAVRTSDLHAMIDLTTGRRLNPTADVVLEPHVWLGDHVIVGKGVCVKFGSVVGARSFVNRTFPRFSLLAGTPARRVRGDVSWTRHGDGAPGFVAETRAWAARIPEFGASPR